MASFDRSYTTFLCDVMGTVQLRIDVYAKVKGKGAYSSY